MSRAISQFAARIELIRRLPKRLRTRIFLEIFAAGSPEERQAAATELLELAVDAAQAGDRARDRRAARQAGREGVGKSLRDLPTNRVSTESFGRRREQPARGPAKRGSTASASRRREATLRCPRHR